MRETVRAHPHIAGKVGGHWRGNASFSYTSAIADRAASLEMAARLQLSEVWPPIGCAVVRIVVHEKNVIGHIGLPDLYRLGAVSAREPNGPPAGFWVFD